MKHHHAPAHAPAHFLATLIGPSVSRPDADRRLLLGAWQRIILVEPDGPPQRTIRVAAR